MKKSIFNLIAGLAALAAVSCAQEELMMFDASKATAPVLQSFVVTDDAVTVDFTPGAFGQDFNQKMPVNHSIVLKTVNGAAVNNTIPSSVKDGKLIVTVTNLSKALMAMGYEEGQKVAIEMAIRASMQEVARDNGRNGFVESAGLVSIPDYEVFLPTGDPYARYTEKSAWGLVGSFNGWGSDPDVEMWTNGTLHVAKAVRLSAGDEVKFRKDASWDVNYGYASEGQTYTLGEEFPLSGGGPNIVILEDGLYDFILDPDGATARIIESVAQQEDPYAAYKDVSPWSVIGSFNSWGGDVEMVTNGTLHVCKNITLAEGDEFKFRKDASWDVNFGYSEGVDSYTLGEEFSVAQGGGNIVIAESGAYDLFLDPENATARIIKTQAVTIDPYAAYKDVSPWSVIGSFNSWGGDVEMVTNGTLHVAKGLAFNAGTEWKFRKDASWDVNFGYVKGSGTQYVLGEEFEVAQDGDNIVILEDGVYDLILDPENATAKVIASIAVDKPEPPVPEEKPGMWSLIGTIEDSGWGKDFDMTNTSGDTWIIRSVKITASDEFKIRADHDWGKSYGGPEGNSQSVINPDDPYEVYKPEIGKVFEAKDKNIQIGIEGVYDVTFDYAAKTILIENHVAAFALIGSVNGSSWNQDVLMTEKDGVWTSPVVKIAGEFKIRYDYSWADENTYGLAEGGETLVGTPFTLVQPGANMKLEEGDYKVQFTPATMEVLITAVNFPEQLYMIGDEFGGWDWSSDGVVPMVPVVNNAEWGADGEGQFWTVRYISAGKGFKFNSKREWGGDFWGLETNEGFTESGGNCTVDADGLYLVHVDMKRNIVHVEPVRIYGIGSCFGGWNEGMEEALFKADGKTLKAKALADGELRMYVASAIATDKSAWWTREFIIIDGKIDYRGDDEGQGDQTRVKVLKGQDITLDFNAGTGSITGEGEASELPTTMYMIGDGVGGWDWAANGQDMVPVKDKPGQFWAIRYIEAGKGFKFCAVKEWNGDFYSLGEADSGYTVDGGNCLVAENGVYMIYVDTDNKKICIEKAQVYGIGNCFGGWDAKMASALFTEKDGKLVGKTIAEGEIRIYAESSIATSDWWTREFVFFDGKIAYRGKGDDQERVVVGADKTVTLDFNAGTAVVE